MTSVGRWDRRGAIRRPGDDGERDGQATDVVGPAGGAGRACRASSPTARPASCGGASSTRSRRSERAAAPPGARPEPPQNIATAIAEISERATLLVHEEIELAKAEVTEKATKLARGAVVGVAAGIFFVTALIFVLVGCAWLLYYYLPATTSPTSGASSRWP